MSEVALRPKARADLDSIWNYTVASWGRGQAENYLRELNRTFEFLAGQPGQGRSYDEVREGLRVYPSGKHLIFYFAAEGGIDVVRVLHSQMDIPKHL